MIMLGDKIRALRKKHEMRVLDLYLKLGISPATLYKIEHNQRGVTAKELLKLEEIFKQKLTEDEYAGRIYGYLLSLRPTEPRAKPHYFPIEIEAERRDANGVYRLKNIEEIHDEIMEMVEKIDDTSLEGITFMGAVSAMN